MLLRNTDLILSLTVPPDPVPESTLAEQVRLQEQIATLESSLRQVNAETQRLQANASRAAIEATTEVFYQEFSSCGMETKSQQILPEEYRSLMQVAGLISPKIEVALETQKAANDAITRLLETPQFEIGYTREKNLAILDGRWVGSTIQEQEAYRFAVSQNSDPIVAKFLLEQFLDANSYHRAGVLAQCLAGTNNQEVLNQVYGLLNESINVVERNLTYGSLKFQHLLAPMILKGTNDSEGIDLLVQALRLDNNSLADRFHGLAVIHGQPAEQYLRFVARSLTPSMGPRVEDLILKTMLDPELPDTVRRSLFVNCLLDPMKDHNKLQSTLGFLRNKLPNLIQANYLRICRMEGESFGEMLKGTWDVASSLVVGPNVTKQYLNQIRTIANFLVGPKPEAGLFALEKRGLDYALYNRAIRVLQGSTGRQDFF